MNSAVYRVYWTKDDIALFADYSKHDLCSALKYTETLRTIQRAGGNIKHIIMSCEHPDSVGHPGVDVTGPEYSWKKRRI